MWWKFYQHWFLSLFVYDCTDLWFIEKKVWDNQNAIMLRRVSLCFVRFYKFLWRSHNFPTSAEVLRNLPNLFHRRSRWKAKRRRCAQAMRRPQGWHGLLRLANHAIRSLARTVRAWDSVFFQNIFLKFGILCFPSNFVVASCYLFTRKSSISVCSVFFGNLKITFACFVMRILKSICKALSEH